MRSMLLKDFLTIKKQLALYLVVIAFYMIFAFTQKAAGMVNGFLTIFAVMSVITAMSYDERAKWDSYALTMPISRSSMVVSKYILGIILLVITTIISAAFNLFLIDMPLDENYAILVTFFCVGIIFIAVLLPIFFKVGVEKGRMAMMIVIFIPTILLVFSENFGLSNIIIEENMIVTAIKLLPLVVIVLLGLSLFISIKIYDKKEF